MDHSWTLLVSAVDNCEPENRGVWKRSESRVSINWNARRESLFVVRDVVMSSAFRIDSITRCANAQWKVSRVTCYVFVWVGDSGDSLIYVMVSVRVMTQA